MVDVQPHYFGGLIDRADLVIDHHPEQPGYTAVFKDIRADYGSTCTILTEHLRAVDVEHFGAHGDGDALRDQVGHAVLQPSDQSRGHRGLLVPVPARRRGADPEDGRRGNHHRAPRVRRPGAPGRAARRPGVLRVSRADRHARTSSRTSRTSSCRSSTSSGRSSPGVVNETVIISVRNLGYSKNAGEFVRRYFSDVGNAGGHRSMAKAVVPMRAFVEKFGALEAASVGARLQEVVTQFLHEAAAAPEKKRETRQVDVAVLRSPLYVFSPHPLATRSDHRLDELVVGILVPVPHQLGERLAPVRSIVVFAGKIERADRVVAGTNREGRDPGSAPGHEVRRVADGRGFRRLQVLAEPRPCRRAGPPPARAGPAARGPPTR